MLFASLAGCTAIPRLPEEAEVPVQEIVTSAICELRDTFVRLSDKGRYPKFKANEWATSISLTPRVDTDLSVRFGITRRFELNAKEFVTWTLGTNPGLEFDVKGRRDGSATYVVHSSDLLVKHARLDQKCGERLRSAHALAQYHGVYEWWARLIPTNESGLSDLTRLDNPPSTATSS